MSSRDSGMFNAGEAGMKTSSKVLIGLAAAVAFSLAYPVRANLITNGGFETGDFAGWTQSRGFVEGETFGITPHSGNFQATYGRPNGSLTQSVATTVARPTPLTSGWPTSDSLRTRSASVGAAYSFQNRS